MNTHLDLSASSVSISPITSAVVLSLENSAPNYEEEVWAWGKAKPWTVKLSHKVRFGAADVLTDGVGNILALPLLLKKPCFGRPETFFRHGAMVQIQTVRGRVIESTSHQCGRCPVRYACQFVCKERVLSDPNMTAALRAWKHHSESMSPGKFIYTGSAGFFWTDFKRAVAGRGRFSSSNDEAIREHERAAVDAVRMKATDRKRASRERLRREKAKDHEIPSPQYLLNAERERDDRADILFSIAGDPKMPPCVSKIPSAHARRTAEITADAWLMQTIDNAMGFRSGYGTLARKMFQDGRGEGLSMASLKARMFKDLCRVAELEQSGVWSRFDPDLDLLDEIDLLNDPADDFGPTG